MPILEQQLHPTQSLFHIAEISSSSDLPLQSSFLYRGKWSHEIDSIILDTLLRLKKEYACEGSVFPSHFIFEAQSLVEHNFGLIFEWWELVDRIHFLEQRYTTFNQLIHLEGTLWNEETNEVIVSGNTWANHLPVCSLLMLHAIVNFMDMFSL